jgi:hypothetical protein
MSADRTVDWPELLNEAMTAPGNLYNTYSRFHPYSLGNMMLFRQQGYNEPMGSMKTWNQLGRRVLAGQHAGLVIVPKRVEVPVAEDETRDERQERFARLIGFRLVNGVFGYSQTSGPEIPARPTPGWDLVTALGKLGVRERPFDQPNGNLQGYSIGTEFAINPIAINRTKTIFHELGHIVLGHTLPARHEQYATHRGLMEFQAEAVAYLAMNELEQLDEHTAEVSRGYIQHWLRDEKPSDKAIQHVFRATEAILRSGRAV